MRERTMQDVMRKVRTLWDLCPWAQEEALPEPEDRRGREFQVQRGFSRYKVMVPTVARTGRRAVSGLSASVSLGGIFLVCAQCLPRDTVVTVEMAPPGGATAPILAHGTVAYHRGQGMGIRFTGVAQADYQRLQVLVRNFLRA